MPNWLTLLIGTALVVAPQVVPLLPADAAIVASAILAAATNIYHLYQPAPNGAVRH